MVTCFPPLNYLSRNKIAVSQSIVYKSSTGTCCPTWTHQTTNPYEISSCAATEFQSNALRKECQNILRSSPLLLVTVRESHAYSYRWILGILVPTEVEEFSETYFPFHIPWTRVGELVSTINDVAHLNDCRRQTEMNFPLFFLSHKAMITDLNNIYEEQPYNETSLK